MFKRKRVVIIAGLCFIALLVWRTPATLITPLLPPTVRLEGVSGSIWSGAAARAQVDVAGRAWQLGRLRWTVGWSLQHGVAPRLTFDSAWGEQVLSGHVTATAGGTFYLDDISVVTDLRPVQALVPIFIGGQLEVFVEHLSWHERRGLAAARGQVYWRDAVWTANRGDVGLGSYVLDVSGTDGQLRGDIVTRQGPLQLQGEVSMNPSAYQLDVLAQGPLFNDPDMQQAVALFAVPEGEGYRIALSGSLPALDGD